MVASDMLTLEAGFSPHSRVAQRAREVQMHQTGNVLDGLTLPQGERPIVLGRMTGRLRVRAHNAQPLKQERSELTEPVPAQRRNGKSWIAQSSELLEDFQVFFGVAHPVGLVVEQQRGQTQ